MRILTIAVLCLLGMSCRKDKLDDGKEIFIGTWNWEYTEHTHQICSGDPPATEILTPETEGDNYSMVFLEKGIVEFYKSGIFLEKHKLKFSSFEGDSGYGPEWKEFYLYLNYKAYKLPHDSNYLMYGRVSPSELIFIRGFPYLAYEYPAIEDGCDDYSSFFKKE